MTAPLTPNQQTAPLETDGGPLSPLLYEISAKHNQLEQTVRELREQVKSLEAEREQLMRERDGYRKQFHFLADKYLPEAPPELVFTQEEFDEAVASGRNLGDLIRELESTWVLEG